MQKFSVMLFLFTIPFMLPLQAALETEKTLYERIGGAFAIAMVIDHFSDAAVQNPMLGKA